VTGVWIVVCKLVCIQTITASHKRRSGRYKDVMQTTSFETAIGRCEIGWTERGIARVRLPGPGRSVHPATEVPDHVRQAIEGIRALLRGEPADLSAVPVDLGGAEPFDRRVYEAARSIQPGRTSTYGELAAEAGEPGEARAVGVAMARNRVPLIVPCHRVVAADGRLGGFSAPGGTATKRRLLEIEGAHTSQPGTLFAA
jgi:methylated-DNA-[protein]-cysteine S-methyltransferase